MSESPSSSSIRPVCSAQVKERIQKWSEMFSDWDKVMENNYEKVRTRCRKGIPHSLRAAAWRALCGATNLQHKNPGVIEELLAKECESMRYIELDVPRYFRQLSEEKGWLEQTEMKKVLKAYSVYNPKVGYVSGMTSIAGMLLMLMPAEQAFWCFVAIMDKYVPGYYSAGMLAMQLDGKVMESLIHQLNPKVSSFLQKNDVQATYYAVEWFLCAYTTILPYDTVLRIWDMFLCEGVNVLIKTGITLLLLTFGDKKVRDACNRDPDKIPEYLKFRLPKEMLAEQFFVNKLLSFPISEEQIKDARMAQLATMKD